MPELPEVETTRRGIEPHVLGRTVKAVIIREDRLRWPIAPELQQCITGQQVDRVERRAKYILLGTSAGQMMIHLGMSGSLRVLDEDVPPARHDHVDLLFDDGKVLRFRDPRRFGSMFWLSGSGHFLLDDLGPEPLDPAFTGDYLFHLSRKRKVVVKSFIMNSHVVVGVGNIYANEALFRVGIRPRRAAGRVTRTEYETLAAAIKVVLTEAIAAGGTTLKDFVNESGSPGYFRHDLKVYGRGGEPCLTCKKPLKEIRVGQRQTVYCSNCQR